MRREKERKVTKKELYRYKRFVKRTFVKLDFSHFKYKSMQIQEKKRGKNKDNPRIKKQKPETRHIHRLESVVLGRRETFLTAGMVSNKYFWKKV